jgi:hypothetical protein
MRAASDWMGPCHNGSREPWPNSTMAVVVAEEVVEDMAEAESGEFMGDQLLPDHQPAKRSQ